MEEIWKDIPGAELYAISNQGRLKNKSTGQIKKPQLNAKGDPELIRQCINPKYNRSIHKGYHFKPIENYDSGRRSLGVRIKETGEEFGSLRECERAICGAHTNINRAIKTGEAYKDLHFEATKFEKKQSQPFLYPHQAQAVKQMFNGCILNGGVGSGKSRTALYYYFSLYGGSKDPYYIPMKNPDNLIIITTAKKRNDKEWEQELTHFLLSTNSDINYYKNEVVVDSWQNIKKYENLKGCFFLFDEDKVTGKGAWAKSFLKIAKSNRWIILSASPGDRWEDYETVFIANGFFRTRGEFRNQHLVYSPYISKYPKVTGYRNEGRLIRLREKLLIDMDFERHTIPHHEDIYVQYDIARYRDAMRNRWDPFKNAPIEQAAGLCYVLRRIVNEDESRQIALLELFEKHQKMIVFYSFDYERDILLNLGYGDNVQIAEYSGHAHEPIPNGSKWIYLVQYTAGCEGFNCITTDTIVFFSQNYSYKVMLQASGRIDRLNSPYTDLYYYHLKSRSGIDLAISRALSQKRNFNEGKYVGDRFS